jgi:hypothetical protein
VDSSFDTARDKDLTYPRDVLLNIVKGANTETDEHQMSKYLDNNKCMLTEKSRHDKIINSLPKVLYDAFKKYNTLLYRYKTQNVKTFDMVNQLLYNYFDNLIEDDKEEYITDIDEYYTWRLTDSAMMCIAWHLVLFMEIPFENITPDHEKLFELGSILVAYHNDILSYHRDVSQNVNNLTKCIEKISSSDKSIKDIILETIVYVNNMYTKSYDEYKKFCQLYPKDADDMAEIFLSVVKGSYNWANGESRYIKGINMINALKKKDDHTFNMLFDLHNNVSGDPLI